MKRLRNIIGVFALCSMTAFMTGCGDDDDDGGDGGGGGGGTTVAPASLNDRTVTLTESGNTISFANNAYTFQEGSTNETGAFQTQLSGNTHNVTLTPSGGQPSNLQLSFTTGTSGSYTFQRPGQAGTTSGSFTLGGGSTTDGNTTDGNTTDGNTTDGNTTDGNTTDGNTTDGNTTTGPGTVPAPTTAPSAINVRVTQSVLGPGATYTINLSGGNSGNFNITGGSTGSGTYTYTATGNNARLRLDYSAPQGDYDDMNLHFQAAPGSSTESPFSGTQRADPNEGAFAGFFTY